MCGGGGSPRPRWVLSTAGRGWDDPPHNSWREHRDAGFNVYLCFCLLRFVCASVHMHTLQCECGCQRTSLWNWFPPFNFVGTPGSKLRPPGLHEPVPSPAEPS